MVQPNELTATQAVERITSGRLSSVDLVKSCLEQIDRTEPELKAWAHLDGQGALDTAARMDAIRKSGKPTGALHGVPVGLKDIIDTADMPTARGTPIFAGRQPDADAAVVDRLREAGAVIMGKTVTTELAFVYASQTRNPHNHAHSPGGSSSGSAAAVAAFNVPLAVGTQTNGSVIRPASFCGVYGFKPTRGVIPRRGVLHTSNSLDQLGGFGRTLDDVALLADVMAHYDPADTLSYPRPRPRMLEGAHSEPPVVPTLAWLDMPYADKLAPDARDGLDAVVEALGDRVERMPADNRIAMMVTAQHAIHEYEILRHQSALFDAHWDDLSTSLRPVLERARKISDAEYQDALAIKAAGEAFFADFFNDFDAVIAPAAPGEAPPFGPGTGDPIFSTIWTLAGLPCVTLPFLVGETGLPIGVQLIAGVEEDDRLLRTAAWVQNELQATA